MSHTLRDVTSFLKITHISLYLLYLFLFIMRKLFRRTLLMAIVLLAGASTAAARVRQNDGCQRHTLPMEIRQSVSKLSATLSAPSRTGLQRAASTPMLHASWGTVTWDNGVLDYHKDKLMQVGFSPHHCYTRHVGFRGGTQPPLQSLYGEPSLRYATPTTTFCGVPPTGNIAILQYGGKPFEGRSQAGVEKIYHTAIFHRQQGGGLKAKKECRGYLRSLIE